MQACIVVQYEEWWGKVPSEPVVPGRTYITAFEVPWNFM